MTEEEFDNAIKGLVERGIVKKRWDEENGEYVYSLTEMGEQAYDLLNLEELKNLPISSYNKN